MARRSASADELRRIDTVGNAFRYFATVVVVLVAGMLILNELGISIAPILATAGVAGIAIAFGAQSLIKDYFTGFFLLIEDQIRVGDVVEVAGRSGLVEELTLRYVRLRDFDGHVTFVPNGEIKLVVNRTRVFAFAVVDAAVAEEQDIDQVYALIREVTAALRADPQFGARIVEDRKSTRLNSSHSQISYAVFCLKKKRTHPRSKKFSTSNSAIYQQVS